MDVAEVKIWGELVGAVAWDDVNGLATFEYDPKFIAHGWDLAPLQMPIASAVRTFSFSSLRKPNESGSDTFRGLPGLLADVLPDRYGNELINIWLTQQGRPINDMNPVELLCFIGSRGMGALEFHPPTLKESKRAFTFEVQSLVETAQRLLTKKAAFRTYLPADEEKALEDILRIGTSAGGARAKAVIAYNETTGEVRSGQTNAPKGFEHWLIKLDGVRDVQLGVSHGFGRVEMAYYTMATACGIIMMPSRLLVESDRAHFMTKRFDREGGTVKHHVQTLCAMKHFDFNSVNSFSYEQLFQTMRELKCDYAAAEQMFRRMVFNVAARNCDDHTKNFSFMLKQDQQWELAPAYDICHAYQPNHRWVSQHALSVNTKRTNISREDLLVVAKDIKLKKAENIIDEINTVVSQWKQYADAQDVAPTIRDHISETLVNLG